MDSKRNDCWPTPTPGSCELKKCTTLNPLIICHEIIQLTVNPDGHLQSNYELFVLVHMVLELH